MESRSTFEYIDRYLNDKLPQEEKVVFEARLAHDQEMIKLVEDQKSANQLLLENRLLRLKNTMQTDIQSGKADQLIRQRQKIRWLGGLGIVSLVTIGIVLYNHTEPTKSPSSNVTDKDNTASINNLPGISDKSKDRNNNISHTTQKKRETSDSLKGIDDNTPEDSPIPLSEQYGHISESIQKTETKNIQATSLSESKDLCKGTVISIKGETTETCLNKQEGMLNLSISGGNVPYTIELYKSGDEDAMSNTKENRLFNNLEKGEYTVAVTDKNGCTAKSTEFLIKEKKCEEDNVMEYSFRPEYNEQFKYFSEEAGNIRIINRAGKEILDAPLNKEEDFIWEGMDRYGKLVEKGMYLFIVTNKEGNSKKGYITVY